MGKYWRPASYPFTVPPEDSDLCRIFTREELLEDLQYMVDTCIEVHPNLFFSLSREELDAQIEQLRGSLTVPLTRLEFYRKIAPIVARFNDGHTMVPVPNEEYQKSDETGSVRFPFSVTCSAKAITLCDTPLDAFKSYLGKELVGINGEPVDEILDEMLSMMTGERIEFKCSCIPMVFAKLLFVLRGGAESYSLKVFDGDFSETVSVPGVSREQSLMISSVSIDKSTKPYSCELLEDLDCAVLSLLRCEDEERFKEFCAELFSLLNRKKVGRLLIDLRHNGGGSAAIGDELCAYLTEKPVYQFTGMEMKISRQVKEFYTAQFRDKARFPLNRVPLSLMILLFPPFWKKAGGMYKVDVPKQKPLKRTPHFDGRVYAVTSQFTYSAAASLAAMIKAHNLGVLIGEPTGGNASSYGDVFSFSLPNTKLRCGVSHKFYIGPDGSRKPEPTTPDLDTRDSGIDLNSSGAIRNILELIEAYETKKTISTEPQHEPDACNGVG